MRGFTILVVLVVILLIGGGLTAALNESDITKLLPVIRQTNVAEGSFVDPAPWQAEQFILFVGFLLFNLVGIGLTIALIMWFLDRGVRHAKASVTRTNDKPIATTE